VAQHPFPGTCSGHQSKKSVATIFHFAFPPLTFSIVYFEENVFLLNF